MGNKILDKVNKVYRKEHPSFYTKITQKNLSKLIIAREKLLLNLKLPKKIFQNSSLLDLGSGSGFYTKILKKNCTKDTQKKSNINKFSAGNFLINFNIVW